MSAGFIELATYDPEKDQKKKVRFQENFGFSSSTTEKKVLYAVIILFLLAVIAYYIHTKYYSGVRLSMCGMN